jgi:hypothetical protein
MRFSCYKVRRPAERKTYYISSRQMSRFLMPTVI